MLALAGSLYLLSTLAFGIVASVIGIRLIALSRRTGQTPERWLGSGLLATAGLGYTPMIVAIAMKGVRPEAAASLDAVITAGWVVHNLGVMCMLTFIVQVFRPDAFWARALAFVMVVLLWAGWGLYVQGGGIATAKPNLGYWIAFATIGTYPLWSGIEAFRYHALMKKRLTLGLADPLVVDRFRLWGVASLCAMSSIWIVNVPTFVGVDATTGTISGFVSACMVVTAGFGTATVCLYWLTFFPPAWYQARLAGSASA